MAAPYFRILALVRKLLQEPKVRSELLAVGTQLGTAIAKSGRDGLWQARRQKALAEEVARQTEGGQLSYATIIDGVKHTVVWVDREPIAAFPPYDGDLAAALSRFRRSGLEEPPPRKAKVWESEWWAPPGKPRVWQGEWWRPPSKSKVWQKARRRKARRDEDPPTAPGESTP
jgi:hypothetical protein